MELFSTISAALGLAWGSGLRLYLVVFLAGSMQRLHWLKLPGSLSVLANTWVLVIAGVLVLVEFLADKFPVVDSAWDAVHTFIRIPAGAVLAAAALGSDAHPVVLALAGLVGGAVTGTAHLTKATTRAAINTSPEPVSNIVTSFGEDAAVTIAFWLALLHPFVWALLFAVIIVASLLLLYVLQRFVRAIYRRIFGKKGSDETALAARNDTVTVDVVAEPGRPAAP
jgi:uncharacterized membrane protein